MLTTQQTEYSDAELTSLATEIINDPDTKLKCEPTKIQNDCTIDSFICELAEDIEKDLELNQFTIDSVSSSSIAPSSRSCNSFMRLQILSLSNDDSFNHSLPSLPAISPYALSPRAMKLLDKTAFSKSAPTLHRRRFKSPLHPPPQHHHNGHHYAVKSAPTPRKSLLPPSKAKQPKQMSISRNKIPKKLCESVPDFTGCCNFVIVTKKKKRVQLPKESFKERSAKNKKKDVASASRKTKSMRASYTQQAHVKFQNIHLDR